MAQIETRPTYSSPNRPDKKQSRDPIEFRLKPEDSPSEPTTTDPRVQQLLKLVNSNHYKEVFAHLPKKGPNTPLMRAHVVDARDFSNWNSDAWSRLQPVLGYVIPGYEDQEKFPHPTLRALFDAARDADLTLRSGPSQERVSKITDEQPFKAPKIDNSPEAIRFRYHRNRSRILDQANPADQKFYQTFAEVILEEGLFAEISAKRRALAYH